MQVSSTRATKKAQLLFRTATAALGISLLAGAAHAQADGQGGTFNPGSEFVADDVIIVTGSRIARPNVEANIPVAVIGNVQLQEDAATNVQDILNEMPQVGIGTSRTNSNFLTGANGVATVDLRNMGEDRTLVLINGRRSVPGLAGSSAVDINNIPTDFVDRIDIITGGASAVYGSDAIAGVVNFVLKERFEGFQLRAQSGMTFRKDNPRYMISATGGTNWGADDRGNIMVNFTYDRDDGLLSRKRGISAEDCFFEICGPDAYSSYAPQGRFELRDANGVPVNGLNGQPLFTFNPDNSVVEGFPSGYGYNRNNVRRISVPVERYLVTGIANYELTDSIKAYAEVTYAKVKSSSQIEASALETLDIYPNGGGIPITNPFIPASVASAIAALNSDGDPTNDVSSIGFRRRQNEVFSRSNKNDRDTWRTVVGVRGAISDNWAFDASYVFGQMKDLTTSQDIDNARYRNALDAVRLGDGSIVCRSEAARAEGCVPINIFGYNTASPEASAYVRAVVPKSEKIKNTQHVATAGVSGTPFALPAGDVGVAFGVEYRKESSVDDLDILTNTGGNSGNMIPDTRGSFNVKELYGEVRVPLLADRPFVNSLELNGAARYSDYSTVGGVFSWNVGGEWEPVNGVKIRTVYAVANRAPNIVELFSAPSETFPGSSILDPCIGVSMGGNGNVSAQIADACRAIPGFAQTVAASPNGTFDYTIADVQGINGFDGGNPNLKEETAKTFTLGLVAAPPTVPGLTFSVDYFNIKVKDAIDTVPRDVAILGCLETGEDQFCDNVIRFPTGRIQTVNAQLINVADLKTSGIDFSIGYSTPLGLTADDNINVNLFYTHLLSLEKRSFPNAPLEENLGQLDGDGRLGAGFKNKATGRVTYTTGPYSVSWQATYLGKIKDTLGGYDDAVLDRLNSVGAKLYNDVQLRAAVGERRAFEFYFGIDNLFDVKPPFLPSGFASSITGTETAADTYDPFGRRFYAGFRAKF